MDFGLKVVLESLAFDSRLVGFLFGICMFFLVLFEHSGLGSQFENMNLL